MDKYMFKAWVKAQMLKQSAKDRFEEFKTEDGGADSVIIAVIIIILVLGIGFIFRDAIIGWFSGLMDDTQNLMDTSGSQNISGSWG